MTLGALIKYDLAALYVSGQVWTAEDLTIYLEYAKYKCELNITANVMSWHELRYAVVSPFFANLLILSWCLVLVLYGFETCQFALFAAICSGKSFYLI